MGKKGIGLESKEVLGLALPLIIRQNMQAAFEDMILVPSSRLRE